MAIQSQREDFIATSYNAAPEAVACNSSADEESENLKTPNKMRASTTHPIATHRKIGSHLSPSGTALSGAICQGCALRVRHGCAGSFRRSAPAWTGSRRCRSLHTARGSQAADTIDAVQANPPGCRSLALPTAGPRCGKRSRPRSELRTFQAAAACAASPRT